LTFFLKRKETKKMKKDEREKIDKK